MSSEGLHEGILDLLYEGVIDARAMEKAIGLCAVQLAACGGNIQITSKSAPQMLYFTGYGDGYTDDRIALYLSYWQYANAHRAAMRRVYENNPGRAFLCHEHISDLAFASGAYFQGFFSTTGLRWLAGGLVESSKDIEVSIAFTRRSDQPKFGEREAAIISELLPHIRRFASLTLRLGLPCNGARTSLQGGLITADTAAFLLDADGGIHWQNEVATQLIQEQAVILSVYSASAHMTLTHGQFTLTDPVGVKELKQNLKTVFDRCLVTTPSRLIIAHTNGQSLELKVAPATISRNSAGSSVLLALVMARRTGLCPEIARKLRKAYSLTPAESALAVLMAEGIGISEAAERKEVSPHTVRTQLRSVFSKTGVNTQAALAALVWRSV